MQVKTNCITCVSNMITAFVFVHVTAATLIHFWKLVFLHNKTHTHIWSRILPINMHSIPHNMYLVWKQKLAYLPATESAQKSYTETFWCQSHSLQIKYIYIQD